MPAEDYPFCRSLSFYLTLACVEKGLIVRCCCLLLASLQIFLLSAISLLYLLCLGWRFFTRILHPFVLPHLTVVCWGLLSTCYCFYCFYNFTFCILAFVCVFQLLFICLFNYDVIVVVAPFLPLSA